jgi:trk system potassium uptake protein TrkA
MAKRRHIVVIGLGRFGSAAARTLAEVGHEVLAVDVDPRIVQEISDSVTHAAQLDATDAEALEELGVRQFDFGIVAVGADIGPSILVTVHLKRLGVPHVIARAHDALHGEILQRVGADRLVFPEQEMGARLAHSFAVPNVVDYLPIGPEYGISKVKPPAVLAGQSIDSLALRERYGITLLMIERRSQVVLNPQGDDTLRPDDLLVVAGLDESMDRLWQ